MNCGNPSTFAGRYFCYNLIYFERHSQIIHAIEREKEIKKWSRTKNGNADMQYKSILGIPQPASSG